MRITNPKTCKHWKYWVVSVCAALLSLCNIQAQTGCSGNGQTSTIRFLVGGFGGAAVNDITVHVGDTLFYQVTVGVPPDGSCPATNVDAFLSFPDGTEVQFLNNADIGQGVSITCPGN